MGRRGARRVVVLGLLGGLASILTACGLPPAAPPPRAEDLPFQGFDQGLVIRWRIDQTPGQARIVGLVDPRGRNVAAAKIEVLGLDAQRRIVSRAQTTVMPTDFMAGPEPFEVRVKTTGQEAAFQPQVLHLRMEDQRGGGN
jgi:hypothetical protein